MRRSFRGPPPNYSPDPLSTSPWVNRAVSFAVRHYTVFRKKLLFLYPSFVIFLSYSSLFFSQGVFEVSGFSIEAIRHNPLGLIVLFSAVESTWPIRHNPLGLLLRLSAVGFVSPFSILGPPRMFTAPLSPSPATPATPTSVFL